MVQEEMAEECCQARTNEGQPCNRLKVHTTEDGGQERAVAGAQLE